MKAPRCEICGGPRAREYYPFCSRRCADVDLQRWLSGAYQVPAAKSDEDDSAGVAGDDEA